MLWSYQLFVEQSNVLFLVQKSYDHVETPCIIKEICRRFNTAIQNLLKKCIKKYLGTIILS